MLFSLLQFSIKPAFVVFRIVNFRPQLSSSIYSMYLRFPPQLFHKVAKVCISQHASYTNAEPAYYTLKVTYTRIAFPTHSTHWWLLLFNLHEILCSLFFRDASVHWVEVTRCSPSRQIFLTTPMSYSSLFRPFSRTYSPCSLVFFHAFSLAFASLFLKSFGLIS